MVESRAVLTIKDIPVSGELVDIAFTGDIVNTDSLLEYAVAFAQKHRNALPGAQDSQER
jgi:hypothetical protein